MKKSLLIIIISIFSLFISDIIVAESIVICRTTVTSCPGCAVITGRHCSQHSVASAPSPAASENSGAIGGGGSSQSGINENQSGQEPCSGGNPISIVNGNKYQVEKDFVGSGEFALSVIRSYNSNSSDNGMFGRKWSSNITANLIYTTFPHEQVKIRQTDGKLVAIKKGGEFWFYENGKPAILAKSDDGDWLYKTDSLTQVFDTSGKLKEQTNEKGHSIMYDYVADRLVKVTKNGLANFTLTYNSYGKVSSITDPNNQQYTYHYDAAKNLIKVVYPGGAFRKYHYFANSLLNGIIDERGIRYASWTYDSAGRAKASWHGNGQETFEVNSFSVNNGNYYRTTTNALGKKTNYIFKHIAGKKRISSVEGVRKGTCLGANQGYTYDVLGYKDKVTDWVGNVTDYDHDEHGNVIKITKAFGTSSAQVENREYWGANSDKPTKITTPLMDKLYEYDAIGRLTKYSMINKGATHSSSSSRTTTVSYTDHPTGLVKTVLIDGPREDVVDTTTLEYDLSGNLIKATNALGHVTTYSNYDNLGRVRKITSPFGQVTNLTFNSRGWLTLRSITDGASTRNIAYTYGKSGLLTKVTHSDGSYYNFEYDNAMLLTKVTDSNDKQKVYHYDKASNITKEAVIELVTKEELQVTGIWPDIDVAWVTETVAEDIFKTDSRYDALSRLTKIIGGNNQTQEFGYRKDNLPSWEKDGLGRTQYFYYDSLKRLTRTRDANNKDTYYFYNTENKLTRVQDPDGRNTYYDRDGFGQIWRLRSPDTGTTSFVYDAAGNVKKQTRANGVISTFTYDALNRQKTSLSGSSMEQTYVYDLQRKGFLHKVTDSSGYSQFWLNKFGELNRRLGVIDGVGHNTYWFYDNMGRVNQIAYPDNRRVLYTYNNTGNVATVKTRMGAGGVLNDIVTSSVYKPFGPLEALHYGNGERRDYGRDTSYRLSALGSGSHIAKNYSFDKNNNVSKIDDITSANQDRNYTYDVLQRLKTHTGPDGSYSYNFDNNGNRTSHVRNGSSTTNYYVSGSNKLYKSGNTNYILDAAGNTKQIGSRVFSYNGENRLSRVTNGSTVVDYKYNVFGQRVYKSKGSAKTYYSYGQGGQLLYEYENGVTKTYVYFNNEIVAYIRNNAIYYVHSDHLGRPQVITNSSKTKVWQAQNNSYNRTVTYNTIGGFNVGFPGQYWDADTNLFYNYFRDYDPITGRYIQSDPIGLLGGLNTYAYVGSNPLNYVDPYGLMTLTSPWGWFRQGFAHGARTGGTIGAGAGGIGAAPGALIGGVIGGLGGLGGFYLADKMFSKNKENSKKPDREQRPDDCPTGTKPIDKDSRLDRGKIHDIKRQLGARPRDWVGVTPEGDVITNEGGESANNGHIEDFIN